MASPNSFIYAAHDHCTLLRVCTQVVTSGKHIKQDLWLLQLKHKLYVLYMYGTVHRKHDVNGKLVTVIVGYC